MLDKYSTRTLLKSKNEKWIDILLRNPNLSDREKYDIAFYGNHKHRRQLLNNIFELDYNTKMRIAISGDNMNSAILYVHIMTTKGLTNDDRVILNTIRHCVDIKAFNNILKEINELRRKKSV